MQAPDKFTSADFGTIRSDLVNYIKSRSNLRDINFDGSAMSVLVDALSYLGNYQAVHANAALGEAFLDTAQTRSSVVSRAKELGYVPAQISSSRASVMLSCTSLPNSVIYVPEGATFSSSYGQFVTLKSYLMNEVTAGNYSVEVEVHEGSIIERTFTMSQTSLIPKFRIPDKDCDTAYLRCFVTPPSTVTPIEYQRPFEFIRQTPDSQVFYFQEGLNEAIEVFFGDGVVSRRPSNGSVIRLKYLATHGKEANGASEFVLETELTGTLGNIDPRDVTSETTSKASHGADKQTIDSIKISSPRFHAAQNRAVTEDDYKALLEKEFSFIQTANVWGGEKNVPPLYGKVLVAVKPKDGLRLSPATKQLVRDRIFQRYSVVGLPPTIVDPDYLFLDLTLDVDYDANVTVINEQNLNDRIRTVVQDYFDSTVTRFDSKCRTSELNRIVLNAYPTIKGVRPKIVMRKQLRVESGTSDRRWQCDFRNKTEPKTFASIMTENVSGQSFQLREVEAGRIDAFINDVIVGRGIGSLTNGRLDIPRYRFDLKTNEIFVQVTPSQLDIDSVRDGLIVLGKLNIKLIKV
jgi:hypothetical protein